MFILVKWKPPGRTICVTMDHFRHTGPLECANSTMYVSDTCTHINENFFHASFICTCIIINNDEHSSMMIVINTLTDSEEICCY